MPSIILFEHQNEAIREHLPHKGNKCLARSGLSLSISARNLSIIATMRTSNTMLHTNIFRTLSIEKSVLILMQKNEIIPNLSKFLCAYQLMIILAL